MQLVDTNILVALQLDGPFTAAATELYNRDSNWCSESITMVELNNVFATMMRVRGLGLEAALHSYSKLESLLENTLFTVSHLKAITFANQFGVSGYDARFLVLAEQLAVRLVTEDRKLHKAAPNLTCSLDEALAAF